MTLEEQIELNTLNLVLNDRFIMQRLSDDTLSYTLKRYSILIDKTINKYKLLANSVNDPLPD